MTENGLKWLEMTLTWQELSLSDSVCSVHLCPFSPFLSVSVCFCPFLSVSVHLVLFLSVSVCFYPFLSVSVSFCPFLSVSDQVCQFLSFSVQFCPFLSASVRFGIFLVSLLLSAHVKRFSVSRKRKFWPRMMMLVLKTAKKYPSTVQKNSNLDWGFQKNGLSTGRVRYKRGYPV